MYSSNNENGKKFRVFMGLTFNRTLSLDEVEFFEQIYNRYDLPEIENAVNRYVEQQKGKRFLKIPAPNVLGAILRELDSEKELEELGPEVDCRFCGGKGEAMLLWAGNNRATKYNWQTKENHDGMRIVKEKGDWEYAKNSICPCSCVNGHRKFLKGNKKEETRRAESWEAIKRLSPYFQYEPVVMVSG